MSLNKNYTRIEGTDAANTIDNTNDTQLTEIEADMTTIESHLDSVANPHVVTASQVGLGNCDNTSDANKPVSTATQTALDAKAPLASPTLVTPTIGVATATSINKVAITAPATSATLTIANTKTLTVSDDATVSGTNTGDQTDATLSFTDITTNNASATKHGFLKKLENTGTKYLRDDGTWVVPAGAGDVVGPATNTANKIPQWDGADSKTLKDGVTFIDEDSMATNSDTAVPSQQSVKAYADAKLTTPAAWTSFTPTFTNLTVGNGTLTCAYCQIGKRVDYRIYFKMGTTSSVAGSIIFTLPVTSITYPGTASVIKIGDASIYDTGSAVYFGPAVWSSTTTAAIQIFGTAATYLGVLATSSSIPMTWTTNDEIQIQGKYEAA